MNCQNRIQPRTCGSCRWFRPPFQDLHWKGRVRRQVPGRCSVRDDEGRFRDQRCDLHEAGAPIGSDPSYRMAALNQRMKRKNSAIKRRCIEGMREKAIAHAVAINRLPEVRAKQWATRRAKRAAAAMEART